MVNMQQMPGQGGKGAAPQGKGGAMPQGKQGAPQGKQGAQGGPQQAQAPRVSQSVQGTVAAPGGGVGMGGEQRQQAQGKPGFPIFSPMAQAFQGASAAASNPNEGGPGAGAATSPSTEQGGMGV